MTQDISGFGLQVVLIASTTYPIGLPITQFADDADPINMDAIQIADKAMGLNGDLVAWSRAQPLPMVLNVIPGSADDIALQILADANRVGSGKTSAQDAITATIIYPDGSTIVYRKGRITEAPFGKSVASSGRIKTRTYAFAFEQKAGS